MLPPVPCQVVLQDLPRIMKEAFYLARTGRPGPVLVDVPKDIQQQLAVPDWSMPMAISGYMSRLPQPPQEHQLKRVVEALHGVSCLCIPVQDAILVQSCAGSQLHTDTHGLDDVHNSEALCKGRLW